MPSKTHRNAIPRARNTSSQIIYSRSLESQTAATSTTYPADEPSASPPRTVSYLEPEPEPDIVREGIADTRPHQAESDLPAVMYRRVSGDRGSSGGFVSQVQPVSSFQRPSSQPSAADTGYAGEPCIERNAGHVRSPVLSRYVPNVSFVIAYTCSPSCLSMLWELLSSHFTSRLVLYYL